MSNFHNFFFRQYNVKLNLLRHFPWLKANKISRTRMFVDKFFINFFILENLFELKLCADISWKKKKNAGLKINREYLTIIRFLFFASCTFFLPDVRTLEFIYLFLLSELFCLFIFLLSIISLAEFTVRSISFDNFFPSFFLI